VADAALPEDCVRVAAGHAATAALGAMFDTITVEAIGKKVEGADHV
jgi:hypothetical protein